LPHAAPLVHVAVCRLYYLSFAILSSTMVKKVM
jgi:hypothetical protein